MKTNIEIKEILLNLPQERSTHVYLINEFLQNNNIKKVYIVFYQKVINATRLQKFKKIWGNFPNIKIKHGDTFSYENDDNLFYFSIAEIGINELDILQFFINNNMQIIMFTSNNEILNTKNEEFICNEIFKIMECNDLFYKFLYSPSNKFFINLFSQLNCEYIKYFNDLNEMDITYFKLTNK